MIEFKAVFKIYVVGMIVMITVFGALAFYEVVCAGLEVGKVLSATGLMVATSIVSCTAFLLSINNFIQNEKKENHG